jgi:hypothetical protein
MRVRDDSRAACAGGAVAVADVARGAHEQRALALRLGLEEEQTLRVEAFQVKRRGALVECGVEGVVADVRAQELTFELVQVGADQLGARGRRKRAGDGQEHEGEGVAHEERRITASPGRRGGVFERHGKGFLAFVHRGSRRTCRSLALP